MSNPSRQNVSRRVPPSSKAPARAPAQRPRAAPSPKTVRTPALGPGNANPSMPTHRSSLPKKTTTVSSHPAPGPSRKAPISTKPVTSSKPIPSPQAANWINRNIQNRIEGWGNYAGGLVTGVGDGVNRVGRGIGDSITDVTRGWGQGVAGYGNDIKDAAGVGGSRIPTARNPLGLAGRGGGKTRAPVAGTKTAQTGQKRGDI